MAVNDGYYIPIAVSQTALALYNSDGRLGWCQLCGLFDYGSELVVAQVRRWRAAQAPWLR